MKPIHPFSIARSGSRSPRRVLACLISLTFAMSLISCQSPSVSMNTGSRPVSQSHWVRVAAKTPTYYPRGVPMDCATDCRSGEWVSTGDEDRTRYFIPFKGLGSVPREVLVHEALAARSEKKLDEIRSIDEERARKHVASAVIGGPPVMVLMTMAELLGFSADDIDVFRLQDEWYRSKGL